jgi:hypothetical protein
VEFITVAVVFIVVAVVVGAWLFGRSGSGASPVVPPADQDFEIVFWNGRPPPPVPPTAPGKASRDFSDGVRWRNPDAVCLPTGRRAAECTCDTHRRRHDDP